MVAAVGLTDAKIKGLKPPATGQDEYPDSLVPGLRLRVGSSGAKTFILRKRVGGRARNLTLDRLAVSHFIWTARRDAFRTQNVSRPGIDGDQIGRAHV